MQQSKTPIPSLDLQQQYAEIEEEVRAAIDRVIASQHFILGPEVEQLESEIAPASLSRPGLK